MLDIEEIIKKIEDADEVEIMEFDFDDAFTAMREMHYALTKCKETFDFHLMVRGCHGQLEEAAKETDRVLGV